MCACSGGATQQVCKCSLLLCSVVTVNASVCEVTTVRPCNLYLTLITTLRVRNCGFGHRVVTCVYFDVSDVGTRCHLFHRVCIWFRCMLNGIKKRVKC
jgi:hypothetical protein